LPQIKKFGDDKRTSETTKSLVEETALKIGGTRERKKDRYKQKGENPTGPKRRGENKAPPLSEEIVTQAVPPKKKKKWFASDCKRLT